MTFHRWIGEDENLVRCLRCGGLWQSQAISPVEYRYYGIDGEDATACPGDGDQCHHYQKECPRSDEDQCNRADCNCLSCFS